MCKGKQSRIDKEFQKLGTKLENSNYPILRLTTKLQ